MTRTLLLAAVVGAATLLAPAPEAQAQDMEPIMYTTHYRIQEARMDSLATLVAMFDVPWHSFLAERVDGYQRWYYRHDTGDNHNFVIATMYPDWDYVRGDEMNFDAHFEAFQQTDTYKNAGYTDEQINAMFRWAYEGSEHHDNIYRPIMADN